MKYKLIDDKPAEQKQDRLHFHRYLNAIEGKVLGREETTPFVVGIYGKWGSGKSTLMEMLAERLDKDKKKWEVVKFSPWMYRNEKSLLLPLIATLAKKNSPFESLIKWMMESAPGLIKVMTSMGWEAAATGLPLFTFIKSIWSKKEANEEARSLSEKLEQAVKEVTGNDRLLVFLIDDLDRCHDPVQIIGLLEQIKLFLNLPRCLFFICADKDQIIRAIETKFPGEGENYLDKFVQLPLELRAHHKHHLIRMLETEDDEMTDEHRFYYMRISEVLGNNPRKLKKLWNQAVVSLEIVKEEMERVQTFSYTPTLELMLKMLLLMESVPLRADPYLYMKFEAQKIKKQSSGNLKDGSIDHNLLKTIGLKDSDGNWRSEFHRRLAIFLWNDSENNCFKERKILTLYASASGEDVSRSRMFIEGRSFDGKKNFEQEDFSDATLHYGQFEGVEFRDCDFSRADFKGAGLNGTLFTRCDLLYVHFDGAAIENTRWIECKNVHQLITEPFLYEIIADQMVDSWRQRNLSSPPRGDGPSDIDEQLSKIYINIIGLHTDGKTITEEIKDRLINKAKRIRSDVESRYFGNDSRNTK